MEKEPTCANLTKSPLNHCDDLLYNLPEEVIINILSLLPARDAVRTSILSSRWRNQWKFVNNICISFFDYMRAGDCSDKELLRSTEASIHKFLSSIHASKISKFHIMMPISKRFDIDELLDLFVNFSLDRAVEVFSVFDCYMTDYKFPSKVFQIRSLSRLYLSGVKIEMSLSVNLPFLSTLILCHMRICGRVAAGLISRMPSLKRLTLDTCYRDEISINHSKLTYLTIQSEMPVKFNTPSLKLLVFTDPRFTWFPKGKGHVY